MNDLVAALEIYGSERDVKDGRTPVLKIDLKDILSVESDIRSKKFAYGFLIRCKDHRKFCLACLTELDKQSWIQALSNVAEKRRIVYIYKDLSLLPAKLKTRSRLKRFRYWVVH